MDVLWELAYNRPRWVYLRLNWDLRHEPYSYFVRVVLPSQMPPLDMARLVSSWPGANGIGIA
jgi:hypothetical protein